MARVRMVIEVKGGSLSAVYVSRPLAIDILLVDKEPRQSGMRGGNCGNAEWSRMQLRGRGQLDP